MALALRLKFVALSQSPWPWQCGLELNAQGHCFRWRYFLDLPVLLSRVSILLLTRDIDIVILSVRLSVRLSVCP